MADKRTVWQQARSGFRLAGFVLLTFALCLLFLFSTILLTGRGQNRTPVHELLGGCGLLAIATVMFFSVRYWAKWYFAMLVYISFKLSLSLLLGRTPSVPSIVRPRLVFLEYFIVIVATAVLSFRYVGQVPRRIETLGLIALVISFGFSTVYDSFTPLLIGVSLLGSIRLGEFWWHRNWLKAPRSGADS